MPAEFEFDGHLDSAKGIGIEGPWISAKASNLSPQNQPLINFKAPVTLIHGLCDAWASYLSPQLASPQADATTQYWAATCSSPLPQPNDHILQLLTGIDPGETDTLSSGKREIAWA